MTRWLALAIVTITVSTESATIINLPDNAEFIIVPSTPTMCPNVVVTTGPFIFQATDGTDCYTEPYINPNGTWPEAPTWAACPQ